MTNGTHASKRWLAIVAAAAALAGCSDDSPVEPERGLAPDAQFAASPSHEIDVAVKSIRRATDRYHRIERALQDGFVLLHPCEVRPGEGNVGAVYVHMGRLTDGKIDPTLPDALIYEQIGDRRPKLVGAEFAVPYALWTEQNPPQFLGRTFQPEDEFGVFALHAWVWRHNPDGLFAESHRSVSCDEA